MFRMNLLLVAHPVVAVHVPQACLYAAFELASMGHSTTSYNVDSTKSQELLRNRCTACFEYEGL
jgi:hypothetical protein